MKLRTTLPLPGFVLHPFTALVIAIAHVYLSFGHLSKLFGGDVQWTHIWKGFGALAGAYVSAALASRGFAREDKNWFPWFRFYSPREGRRGQELEGKSWKMPDIEKVD
jgi:hypothetical protein